MGALRGQEMRRREASSGPVAHSHACQDPQGQAPHLHGLLTLPEPLQHLHAYCVHVEATAPENGDMSLLSSSRAPGWWQSWNGICHQSRQQDGSFPYGCHQVPGVWVFCVPAKFPSSYTAGVQDEGLYLLRRH